MTNRERVMIFDTTLRDGEQSPGCSMAQPEKLRIARALAELGVDVIEAGFPAASRGDWESVNAVAREVQGPIICGLARCNRNDIELVAKAVAPAAKPRIHVFLATSAIHRQFKLNMAQEEIIKVAVEGVKLARELCDDVEFSPEDASRTELDFLTQVVEAVIDAGATTVNIPDTVGYTVPDEFAELFRYLRKNVRGIDRIRLSVHCHDDLGMAVANSLTAVVAGAADRVHRQWHWRARRQLLARGSRDGAEDARRVLQPRHADRHHAPLPHVAHAREHRRRADTAQQGDRGRERVRARVGHSP